MDDRIIIFEGFDKTGKSTIINQLSKQLGIPQYKKQRTESKLGTQQLDSMISLYYGMEEIVQFLEQTHYPIIIDRFHISEWVYSQFYPGRMTSYEKIYEIDQRLSELNTTIVYCYKDESSYEFDPIDKIPIVQYKKLHELYEKWYNHTVDEYDDDYVPNNISKIIKLNTTDKNINKQIELIKKEIV